MSGIWLKWVCLCLLFVAGASGYAARAQGVPGAIKYQAVLRDVEGEPMADRDGLSVRITLRQGSPAGVILYQETHTDLTTDAFGLLQLEIGRGDVSETGYGNLLEIPWENSPVYAQVEVQADDNGYTMMGASELLSVPYALYAGNASVGLDLTDGVLPKYDAEFQNLVDSKVAETMGGQVRFNAGDNAYTFPAERGVKDQVLVLMDDEGMLGWGTGGGGSMDCDNCQDAYMTYWDAVNEVLRTSDMRYDEENGVIYAGGRFVSPNAMTVEKTLEINATVSGEHNLQYNTLPQYHVWVGGADGKSLVHKLGSGVTIDSVGKEYPVLNFGGDGGGESVWDYRYDEDENIDYVHTKIDPDDPTKRVRVGIGTSDPKTRFHLQDGSLLLSGVLPEDGASEDGVSDVPTEWPAGYHFYWHGGKGALRMGKFEQPSVLWRAEDLGENSIALGVNSVAKGTDNVAIGRDTKAQGEKTVVFGRNATVTESGTMGLALGANIVVSGANAVGIGSGYNEDPNDPSFIAGGLQSVTIGYDEKNYADDAVAVGKNNEVQQEAAGSVVVGYNNTAKGPDNIMIGSDIQTEGENLMHGLNDNIQIGKKLNAGMGMGMVNIGGYNTLAKGDLGICLGNSLNITNNGVPHAAINIGLGNSIQTEEEDGDTEIGPVLIGQHLQMAYEPAGVILGRYNNENLESLDAPALVIGVGTSGMPANALELSEKGELHLLGDEASVWATTFYADGLDLTSDLNLKTDIQPLNADFSVLQALQPVRYRFKADKKQQLQFGFIAQDVEQYFPHLVHTGNKGFKSLNYIGLLPVLWQYTQQLEQTVETQASEIDRLKTELDALKAEVEAVKAVLGLDH